MFLGKRIIVYALMVREYSADKNPIVTWKSYPLKTPQPAIITGRVTKYDGKVSLSGGWGENYEPASFIPSKTHKFYLVRFGQFNKEWPVDLADIVYDLDPKLLPNVAPRPEFNHNATST